MGLVKATSKRFGNNMRERQRHANLMLENSIFIKQNANDIFSLALYYKCSQGFFDNSMIETKFCYCSKCIILRKHS